MNMKTWLISAVTLTLALVTAGAVMAFALTGDAGSDNPEVPSGKGSAGEVSPNLPGYDESLSDFGDLRVVTSIDDIDPNVCNAIHNINACTPEELKELGMAPISASIAVGENHADVEVEGKPEPLFEEGEPGYIQTAEQECAVDQGVYVTSEGLVGCVDVIILDDGGQGTTQAHPPVIPPQVMPSAD